MAITHFYGSINESGIDNANNTSVVTVNLYASWNNGSWASDSPQYSITIDGVELTGTANFNADRYSNGNDVFIASRSITVTHTTNGSKTVNCSAWWEGNHAGEGAYVSWNSSKILTTIPRNSVLGSLNNFNLEDVFSFPVTTYTNNYKDILQINIGNTVVAIRSGYKNNTAIHLTDDEILIAYKTLGTALSTNATISLHSYDGSVLVGTDTKNVTVNISGTAYIKIEGAWKRAVPYKKINGSWVACLIITNVNGSWKRCVG